MTNRFIISLLLVAAVSWGLPVESSAKWNPFKKKVEPTETKAPAKKKTAYEKFVSKKGVEKVEGYMTIYRKGKEVWLEIPDSIMGRSVMLTAKVVEASNPEFPVGAFFSTRSKYTISSNDSTVFLSRDTYNIYVKDGDPAIEDALEKSASERVFKAMPIKYRNNDSTAVLVNATEVFDFQPGYLDFKGYPYRSGSIYNAKISKSASSIKKVHQFGHSVAANREASVNLTISTGSGLYFDHPESTVEVQIALTLCDKDNTPGKKTDSRIGTSSVSYRTFTSNNGSNIEKYAVRWNMEKGITFYTDPLLPETWANAVSEGILAWNVAFEEAGLGSPIKVLPATEEINLNDPEVSSVIFTGGSVENISYGIYRNGGTINAAQIYIPGAFMTSARWAGSTTIADVDTRFKAYELGDDVVCDVLRAKSMQAFGRILGLAVNKAGSYAFTPEQLRSPEFTQEHGIVASVLDNVLFNVLAMPGDKERGVVTMIDRIGSYDKYAIAWLYDSPGFKFDPEQLYLSADVRYDPRAQDNDFGTDPFALLEAVREHNKNILSDCMEWTGELYASDEAYSVLFPERIWLQFWNSSVVLMSYVGGTYMNDIRQGSDQEKYTPVPKAYQRKAFQTVCKEFENAKYFDNYLKVFEASGLVGTTIPMTNVNFFSFIAARLYPVVFASEEAGSKYTVDEYLKDVESFIFESISKGEFKKGDQLLLDSYLDWLIGKNPRLKQNYVNAINGGIVSLAEEDNSFTTAINGIPVAFLEEMPYIAQKYLESAERILKRARSAAKNETTRGEIDYLLYKIAAAFNS